MAAVSIIPLPPPWANVDVTEKSARRIVAQAIIFLSFMIRHFYDGRGTKFVLKSPAPGGIYLGGNQRFGLSVNACFFGVNIGVLISNPGT
jgi:hypothetical protein